MPSMPLITKEEIYLDAISQHGMPGQCTVEQGLGNNQNRPVKPINQQVVTTISLPML